MIATNLEGPWLNIDEVTHKTGKVNNEILYDIQTQRITPIIYTDHRTFLAYSTNELGQKIGHATFKYSGTLGINPRSIQDIVVSDQTILSHEPVTILCPDHIVACTTRYPYKNDTPNSFLAAWEPSSDIFKEGVTIIMRPYEYQTYDDAESGIIDYVPSYYCEDEFFIDHADRLFIRSPNTHYVYGSYYSHVYDQKALRFPVLAVNQLLHPPQTMERIPSPIERLRHHDISSVLERLITAYPKERSGALWNTLRRDAKAAERVYDCDHVIATINHNTIDWISAKGNKRTLKKTSFQTAVSRLRNRM